MREHVKAGESFERAEVTPAQARERFEGEDQDYKVELIDDLVANAGSGGRRGHARDRVAVYERAVHGPVPGPARAEHEDAWARSS